MATGLQGREQQAQATFVVWAGFRTAPERPGPCPRIARLSSACRMSGRRAGPDFGIAYSRCEANALRDVRIRRDSSAGPRRHSSGRTPSGPRPRPHSRPGAAPVRPFRLPAVARRRVGERAGGTEFGRRAPGAPNGPHPSSAWRPPSCRCKPAAAASPVRRARGTATAGISGAADLTQAMTLRRAGQSSTRHEPFGPPRAPAPSRTRTAGRPASVHTPAATRRTWWKPVRNTVASRDPLAVRGRRTGHGRRPAAPLRGPFARLPLLPSTPAGTSRCRAAGQRSEHPHRPARVTRLDGAARR